jgi:hypothetical protein
VLPCYETRSDGERLRSAVDCYALESTPRPLAVAAAVSVRMKRKGNFVIIVLWRNLGHIQSKLDQVLDGLASKPKHRRKRLGFFGLSRGTGGRESRSILEAGSGQFSALDANLGLHPGTGLSSNFSPSVIEAIVEPPARSPLGSLSETNSLLETSQVRQIDLVSTPVSPVVDYAPPEVVVEADFPAASSLPASHLSVFSSATEEAQSQTDRISSPVNGLIKRRLLGSRVISPSPIGSLGLVAVGTTMAEGQPKPSVEVGLEKTMDCCLGDGILIHGCMSGLGSSSEVDMLPEIAQGWQNAPVSIGSTVRAPSVSPIATMKASNYPAEASILSLVVVVSLQR